MGELHGIVEFAAVSSLSGRPWFDRICARAFRDRFGGIRSRIRNATRRAAGHRQSHHSRLPRHTRRVPPAERADGARQRIRKALNEPGEGWTSVKAAEQGELVEIDGKPMFAVANGDANSLSGETPTDLANAAPRASQKAWSKCRERGDPRAAWIAAMKVLLAALVLHAALFAIWKISRVTRSVVTRRLAKRLMRIPRGRRGLNNLGTVAVHRLAILRADRVVAELAGGFHFPGLQPRSIRLHAPDERGLVAIVPKLATTNT